MKNPFRFLFMVACLSALAGCSGEQTQPEKKPDFARGGRVFDVNCAQCHLNDDSEAPQLDEADDWDLRTYQWAAVLKDHAKSGFLRMPAQGGQAKLTDQSIGDALYYIEIKVRAMQ